MEEICGIYAIYKTSLVRTCVYIGQSLDIEFRWKGHKRLLRKNIHYNKHLQNAWNEYGERAFKFVVLKPCKRQDLDDEEQYFIELLKPEYNIIKNVFEIFNSKGLKGRKKKVF